MVTPDTMSQVHSFLNIELVNIKIKTRARLSSFGMNASILCWDKPLYVLDQSGIFFITDVWLLLKYNYTKHNVKAGSILYAKPLSK